VSTRSRHKFVKMKVVKAEKKEMSMVKTETKKEAKEVLLKYTQAKQDEDSQVNWMYTDASCFNPCAWSGGESYKAALKTLIKKHKNGTDCPITLEMPDGSGEVVECPEITDAIRLLKHLKREEEKKLEKLQYEGLKKKFKEQFGKDRPEIEHFVVLMLENRTFDGLQGDSMNDRYKSGEIKRSKWDADGRDLFSYSNKVDSPSGPVDFPVWGLDPSHPGLMSPENMKVPSAPAGPVEKFHFLNMCTYGVLRPEESDIKKGPNMGGFAQQYYLKEQANPPEDGSELPPGTGGTCFKTKHSPVMYIYRKEQMPVFTDLMLNFGCSDVHFSSAPCQTWPNRLFAACGTCYGYYNNIPYVQVEDKDGFTEEDETTYVQSDDVDELGAFEKIFSSYDTDTVFDRLAENSVSWGIYHGQISLAVITTKMKMELWDIGDSIHTLEDFDDDAKNGDLPQFSWLEPNYDAGDPEENDMHPPSNVLNGQKLIRDVYDALRANEERWKHTLFVVTCDEGVGSFDHVKPPAAVDPVIGHDHEYEGFQLDGSPYEMTTNPFTRFGTRVPNLIVSPLIKPRSVVRPKGADGTEASAPYPFDHTSIIRTAFDLFIADPTEHLTERDKVAPSFVHALETTAVNMGLKELVCPHYDLEEEGHGIAHACHGVPGVRKMCDEDATRCTIAGLFKHPHALKSSFATDAAAFFGL